MGLTRHVSISSCELDILSLCLTKWLSYFTFTGFDWLSWVLMPLFQTKLTHHVFRYTWSNTIVLLVHKHHNKFFYVLILHFLWSSLLDTFLLLLTLLSSKISQLHSLENRWIYKCVANQIPPYDSCSFSRRAVLDHVNTRVISRGDGTLMQVAIVVPAQYVVVKNDYLPLYLVLSSFLSCIVWVSPPISLKSELSPSFDGFYGDGVHSWK